MSGRWHSFPSETFGLFEKESLEGVYIITGNAHDNVVGADKYFPFFM